MLSVLLVDDEYIVLKGLQVIISNQTEVDVQIHTACDAVDALQMLPHICPDVIITDINMPEIDGLGMIEKVVEQGYDCKFILISGYENLEYFKGAIKYHVADYILSR